VVNITIDEIYIRIEMLGGFSIIFGETRISEQVKRSSKTWKLLQYLVAHRHKIVSQEELIETFCEDELSDSPGSALRTLVYRARNVLAKSGLSCADNLIVTKSGGYSWNDDLRCEVDAEEFEELCKKADSAAKNERMDMLLRAAALYKGDFLPNSTGELWVMPLARWYRSLYLASVHHALELLLGEERYIEAGELCSKAMLVDPFDEGILEYHLRALLAQGKNTEALDEYKKMESMYYDELGVEFSDELRALYSQIKRPAITDGKSLENMMEEWLDGADFPGAYYCDLSEFKTMLRIESRSVPRSGRTAYVVRFDTKYEPGAKKGGVMGQLDKLIPVNLRMGDLYTRSSPNQYILLLHSLAYEDCKMLIDRIMYGLDSKYLSKIIGSSIKPIKPIY